MNERWAKAVRWAALLHAGGVSASQVSQVSQPFWHELSVAYQVNPPSPLTINLIEAILTQFELAAARIKQEMAERRGVGRCF